VQRERQEASERKREIKSNARSRKTSERKNRIFQFHFSFFCFSRIALLSLSLSLSRKSALCVLSFVRAKGSQASLLLTEKLAAMHPQEEVKRREKENARSSTRRGIAHLLLSLLSLSLARSLSHTLFPPQSS
jgi:hypothetical protein